MKSLKFHCFMCRAAKLICIFMSVSTVNFSLFSVFYFVGLCFVSVISLETSGFACFTDCFVVAFAS